jgi:hypothetical protein
MMWNETLKTDNRNIITRTYQFKLLIQYIYTHTHTIQARLNSDFDVKYTTIQFYGNNHNFQSDRGIGLKFYMDSPGMFSYLGLKFQINRSLGRHRNTGQQKLYEFCYLLSFDLWTSYLARILFPKGCDSLIMTVAVKLDSCTFHIKIRIWPCLDRVCAYIYIYIYIYRCMLFNYIMRDCFYAYIKFNL